jgi:hypothetical protein
MRSALVPVTPAALPSCDIPPIIHLQVVEKARQHKKTVIGSVWVMRAVLFI